MLEKLRHFILFRFFRAGRAVKKIENFLEGRFTEEMLELLLDGMSLVFLVSREFRRNIENFEGRYLFKSLDGSFEVSAEFRDGKMKVRRGPVESPDIAINFKNSQALMNFIFSPKPDVLGAMLKQEVVLDGNLTYLYKFAYLANHLRVKGTGMLKPG